MAPRMAIRPPHIHPIPFRVSHPSMTLLWKEAAPSSTRTETKANAPLRLDEIATLGSLKADRKLQDCPTFLRAFGQEKKRAVQLISFQGQADFLGSSFPRNFQEGRKGKSPWVNRTGQGDAPVAVRSRKKRSGPTARKAQAKRTRSGTGTRKKFWVGGCCNLEGERTGPGQGRPPPGPQGSQPRNPCQFNSIYRARKQGAILQVLIAGKPRNQGQETAGHLEFQP